jgi:hypothetical protein
VRIEGGEGSGGAGGRAAAPEILVDGRSSPDGAIPLVDDGREHAVQVTLRADAARALSASPDDAPRAR